MRFLKLKSCVVLILAVTLLLPCCHAVARAAEQHPVTQVVAVPAQAPLRLVLFIDQTGSMEAARIGRLSADCLAPVFDRLQVAGGELALGLVRDRSDRPLARLFVPPPPQPPPVRALPPNIFEAAAARKREDAERVQYEALHRAWRADVTGRIHVFVNAVAPLFTHMADAPRTDIRSALVRAEIFLAEPNAFPRTPRNAVVFLSDGLDTVNSGEPVAFTVPADLLLVNGTGTMGYLRSLHPIRFEGLDAALRFAVNKERTEGDRNVRR